jgi:hypothetical protein
MTRRTQPKRPMSADEELPLVTLHLLFRARRLQRLLRRRPPGGRAFSV